ncbi:hypothetical protein VE03_08591 [Pseudogymnoascus sp. 23342-1-I1]|nr:hypothetical protein VE03_08591 [Pseudogymnoascus sp. 23342-1-I1]
MSRRQVDPAAERTARNAQTIKSLLKLEGNKSCADCKRNKHPRWASWNLGIFVCIRCSGIHRGMGTHISRVKSVDLDSWTDEQLQSVLVWGNSRANKYWEAKLAPGHVPSEAKMENFIRTKYDSKRWVMDGPIPDPATLDVEGDDDIPLNLVKEKQDLQRSTSQRAVPGSAPGGSPATVRRAPQADLLASEASTVQRANSTPGTSTRQSNFQSAPAPPPKISKPADSLLGLDFFAQEPQPPVSRSSNATPTSGLGGQSRPDLKQSILSLYASVPKPQPQQPHHGSQGSINGLQSQQPQSSFGGLDDAFGGLSFSNTTSPQPQQQQQAQKPNAFAGLGSLQSHRSPPISTPPSTISSGSFFDAKPAAKPTPYTNSRTTSSSSGFNAFNSAPALPTSPPAQSSGMNDLFDFSTPAVASPPKPVTSPAASHSSVFNLTASQPPPKAQPAPAATTAASRGWSNFDAMGTNDAWSSAAKPAPAQAAANDFGWGSGPSLSSQSIIPGGNGFSQASSTPKVSADEEFGGWSSAPPAAPVTKTSSHNAPKPSAGFGAASEDLFSNVWE